MYLMFLVVALIGSQAALFGPAKLGSIPEMLRPSKISSANGLLGLDDGRRRRARHGHRQLAFVGGSDRASWGRSGGGSRRWCWSASPWPAGSTSLMIMRAEAAAPERTFPWDMATQTVRDLKILATTARCCAWRWASCSSGRWRLLAQLNIDQFAFRRHGGDGTDASLRAAGGR